MRRTSTVFMLVALAATVACQDQVTTPLGPEVDAAFSHTSADPAGAATYEVTVTNLTAGQPFTPPLAVTHKKSLNVFEIGSVASLGVREIAENGNLGPLHDALTGHSAVSDLEIALGSPPPIVAGASRTFTITAGKGAKHFSFVSMLICTNDGFTGLDAVRLPRRGDTSVYQLQAYDAGSEVNTEDLADIVPPCAPLTGVSSTDAGTGASNPALAENGVIHTHGGIAGVDDLSSIHEWSGPVATVSITRIDKSMKSGKSAKSDKSNKSGKSKKG